MHRAPQRTRLRRGLIKIRHKENKGVNNYHQHLLISQFQQKKAEGLISARIELDWRNHGWSRLYFSFHLLRFVAEQCVSVVHERAMSLFSLGDWKSRYIIRVTRSPLPRASMPTAPLSQPCPYLFNFLELIYGGFFNFPRKHAAVRITP